MRSGTVWAGLVWLGALVCAARALRIKEDSHTDTELYVAPASYTRKDGKALPSTIIISKPLGVRTQDQDHSSEESLSIDPKNDDSSDGSLDLKPNIKFYRIECTSGRPCTSIIPARTSAHQGLTAKPFTETDIKNYLRQFSLRDGFPYSDDFESSGSPKPPTESDREEKQRAFGSSYFDSPDYWSDYSAYRPRPPPSRGQVFKYEQYDPANSKRPSALTHPGRRPAINWDKIADTFPTRGPATEWQRVRPLRPGLKDKPSRPQHSRPIQNSWPYQSSRPNLPNDEDDDGPPRFTPFPITTTRPPPYDGLWNRYSTSTVSQLDKDTGEWVKISSSNTQLDQGVFKRPSTPQYTLPDPSHHATASLTVLGMSERRPFSTFSGPAPHRGPHVVEVPNALPGRPPALIETDGGHVGGLPITSPRETSSSSSVTHISVTPAGFAQIGRPIRVRGEFMMEQ